MVKERFKQLQLTVGIVVVVAITLVFAVYYGLATGRLGEFSGLPEAKTRLLEVPTVIGDWEAISDGPIYKEEADMLRVQNGNFSRIYRNSKTQAQVNVVMMVGPTGRVVVHTPEICFGGKDYKKSEDRTSEHFSVVNPDGNGESDNSFWKVDFVNNAIGGGTISFYYGVNVGDTWVATENPRSTFRRYRYCYKLQAQAMIDADRKTDPVREFLEECLPTIRQYVLPCR